MTLRTTLLAGLAFIGSVAGAQATTFDLSTVATGTTPTFTITSGGNTATFESVPLNGFQIGNTARLLTFSTALEDLNFFGTDPLVITFSQPVTNEILIPFAIFDAFATGDTLTTVDQAGTARIFSSSPDSLTLGEPEGLIAFVPTTPLTQLTLTSSEAFAIGNITVPEPMSLSLLGMGLAGAAVLRRKKRVG
jgi:hypothetical protein